jgi:hypothetical protein
MPSPLRTWFLSTDQVVRQTECNVNVQKFQYDQLTRLVRTQRQKILENRVGLQGGGSTDCQGVLEQATLALRNLKEENKKHKQ